MPKQYLFNLGLNQHNLGGNHKIEGVSINIGATKGIGSSTRIFNYCRERSSNPSLCINEFITISAPPTPYPSCPPINISTVATFNGTSWVLNADTTVLACQTFTVDVLDTLIIPNGLTITNNGTINNNGTITNDGTFTNNVTFSNNGTINNNGTITNNIGATLTNNKNVNNYGTIANNGTITNNNTILLYSFINYNIITNTGSFINNGEFSNSGGTFGNSGGTITNNGLFFNKGGTLNNTSGIFINNSSLAIVNNSGAIITNSSGIFTNNGTVSNTAQFRNGGFTCQAGTINGTNGTSTITPIAPTTAC